MTLHLNIIFKTVHPPYRPVFFYSPKGCSLLVAHHGLSQRPGYVRPKTRDCSSTLRRLEETRKHISMPASADECVAALCRQRKVEHRRSSELVKDLKSQSSRLPRRRVLNVRS